jgi:hypothetical protein
VGALLEHPLFRTALQQRAPIDGDRSLQRGEVVSRDRPVEGDHVDIGSRQVEGDGAGTGRAEADRLGAEGAADVGEADAEVGEGLGLETVGPEGAGQPGAFHVAAVAEGKEGEKPGPLAGAEARQRLPVQAGVEGTEQPDGQR